MHFEKKNLSIFVHKLQEVERQTNHRLVTFAQIESQRQATATSQVRMTSERDAKRAAFLRKKKEIEMRNQGKDDTADGRPNRPTGQQPAAPRIDVGDLLKGI
jgi:hypothetical protein